MNNSDDRSLDITDLPTDEYPALSESTLSMGQVALEPNGAGGAPAEPRNDLAPAKAALSLTHLEAEVSRLHAKWQSIDAEFENREARIAQLHDEIEARESTIAQLTEAAQRDVAALQVADERLLGKDAEIVDLVHGQKTRDVRIEKLSQGLADTESRHKDTLEKLGQAEAETARLDDLLRREQAAGASLAELNRNALLEHDALRSKLQDLEIYINGRHDRWSELNAELAAHKETLRGREETIKARDATIGRHDEDKRQLLSSIHDLERQCSELVGRRKEREEAYEELQKKLASHLAQTEQLRSEYAARTKETEDAAERARGSQQNVESLERAVKQRDASIEALTVQVEQSKLALGELVTAKVDLCKRIDELEKGVADGVEELQAREADLRGSRDRLALAEEQLSDRTLQLAATQEAMDQKSREADRLAAERDAALKESARARTELDTLGAHARELASLRADAVAEANALQGALAARNELILKLETELRVKQATADILERSVGRITDLGASLAALDERMNGADRKRDERRSAPQSGDFVATVAADDESETSAPPSQPPVGSESLPMVIDAGDPQYIVDIGERTDILAARKLVITIDGQTFDYPILKKQMTIGRGHGSDIRVASHFVSRVHARIKTKGVATILEDAGSKNGLLVNSERVLRRVLRDGDIVSLGDDLSMRFVDASH